MHKAAILQNRISAELLGRQKQCSFLLDIAKHTYFRIVHGSDKQKTPVSILLRIRLALLNNFWLARFLGNHMADSHSLQRGSDVLSSCSSHFLLVRASTLPITKWIRMAFVIRLSSPMNKGAATLATLQRSKTKTTNDNSKERAAQSVCGFVCTKGNEYNKPDA